MTVTFADFINILTLLLVAGILILIRQLGQRRSHRVDKPYRSTTPLPSPFDTSLHEIGAPVPDELERLRKKAQRERWIGLTLHQRNIAKLAAEGKQNGEIALTLSIRPSTVGTHMKRIYKTLDIHSRRELTNFVQEIEG